MRYINLHLYYITLHVVKLFPPSSRSMTLAPLNTRGVGKFTILDRNRVYVGNVR